MQTLETSPVFRSLGPEEMGLVRRSAVERRFAAGETIFCEGEVGDGVYVVREGRVQIVVAVNTEGARKVFAHEDPGDLFGEMAVVDNQPRSASAVAELPTVTWFIPCPVMLEIMERSAPFTASLMRVITRRLRDFNRQFVAEVLMAERLTLLGRFTRSIIHDLKNPLNIINIASELATQAAAPQELRRQSHERIRKQVTRINNMANEIVDFTRSSNTTFLLALVGFDDLVRQSVEDLAPEMEMRGVRLELPAPPPPVRVAVSPERLGRVMLNLCLNACDAMPAGGTVTLRFALQDGAVHTTVEDTGPGIAPEVLGNLFTAFVTHGKPHGTGLGLSICRRIIEDHRGQIEARNLPGGGAAFTFSLPIREEAPSPGHHPAAPLATHPD